MNHNDIYIWSSYIAGTVILIGLAITSWQAKKKAEGDLRRLEKQLQELSEKQVQ